MKQTLLTVAGLLFATASAAQTDVLTVYAPDYFGSEWGPGPSIEAAFEAQCGCDLQYETGDVLPRLLLEGARTDADVVIGLNSDVTKRARESGLLDQHGLDLCPLLITSSLKKTSRSRLQSLTKATISLLKQLPKWTARNNQTLPISSWLSF